MMKLRSFALFSLLVGGATFGLTPSASLAASNATGAGTPVAGDSTSTEANANEQLPLDDLQLFAEIYNQIRQSYVNEVTDRQLLEDAIRGMLAGLDPHSGYLDADDFGDLKVSTTGEFGGLGLEVGQEDGFVKVISPIDDTPAQKAGIESGDLIVKIDNQPVKGMSLNEAVNRMRGKRGTPITLTIVREGINQPFDVTLVRDIIKVVSVRQRMLDEGFGYVRIAHFQTNTGDELASAITKLNAEKPLKGLVLDLRNNPGGVLQGGVDVVDQFINNGLVVYTEGRLPQSKTRYDARPGDLLNGKPLVVLINGGSASASEIVAGALQDHHRAIIMGTRSFGKGSVQTVLPIGKDKAIKLTTALYFTPRGRSIQAQGIEPDIRVDRATITPVESTAGIREADLAGHLNNGNGKVESTKEKTSKTPSKDQGKPNSDHPQDLESDNQLFEAVNLLKGVSILQGTGSKP